jgi:hypothetical protein
MIIYSCLKHSSIGSRLAAFFAGQTPKTNPTPIQTVIPLSNRILHFHQMSFTSERVQIDIGDTSHFDIVQRQLSLQVNRA